MVEEEDKDWDSSPEWCMTSITPLNLNEVLEI